MESMPIHVRIYTISVESTTLHFWREKPVLLKLMVSSWQNEIWCTDYWWFQLNMESLVIDTKLKLKTENWIWSISASLKIRALEALGVLAHLVMSLCNHALSIMWCCHCHQCWCWYWHLCTALPVTALIIETSYLANICSYTPSICTWNIRSMWCIFFKWQSF